MKIKEEYVLQNIADQWVVIDTNAKSVNFNKILALNSSGKVLWDKLEEGADENALANALVDHFGIDQETALKDVKQFIGELEKLECIE